MARFTAAYSWPDGTSPLWGDADDVRARCHSADRNLATTVTLSAWPRWHSTMPISPAWFSGPRSRSWIWIFGLDRAAAFPPPPSREARSVRAEFAQGGVYVMRHHDTHIFIDCGPLGLAGRGAATATTTRCRSRHGPRRRAARYRPRLRFVYTASFEGRNEFRSTHSHNTPNVDGQEMNRFDPENLWSMQNDAQAECTTWRSDAGEDLFVGMHRGYQRLGVNVERRIRLEKASCALEIADAIEGAGHHESDDTVLPGARRFGGAAWRRGSGVHSAGRVFSVAGQGDDWTFEVEPSTISPSYGVTLPSHRLVWKRSGLLPARLRVTMEPAAGIDPACWSLKYTYAEMLLARGLAILGSFGVAILTARMLGPEDRGRYYYIITLAAVGVQFASFGIHSSNSYLIARTAGLLAQVMTNTAWIAVLGGTAAAAGVLLFDFALGDAAPWTTYSRPWCCCWRRRHCFSCIW